MPAPIKAAATWANNAAANTTVVVAGTSAEGHGAGDVIVTVYNPSAITAIQVTPRIRVTDRNGTERTATLVDTAAFTVPASTTQARRIPSMIGIPDLLLQNVTLLGAAQGFTAEVIIQFAIAG
jgi:hypothetical protein